MAAEDARAGCSCKVGEIVWNSLTEGMHERLRARWVGDGEEDQSVRELAQFFNETVLEVRLDEAGVETLDGEVGNLYDHLSGDTSRGMETQAYRQLERHGVDVDAIIDDFVSHQTIYRHLKNCLGVEKDTSLTDEERIERGLERITRLQNRSEVISEDTLEQLQKNDTITLGTFEVLVNYRVTCNECSIHCDFTDLLKRGGCDCA